MPTALIPVADGSEDIETVTLIDVLRRAEVDVTVASVTGKPGIVAARGTRIEADALIEDLVDKAFDLIVLPGGMPGAETLGANDTLIRMLKQQQSAGKLYGAICAAPALALASNGLLEGVAATGHPAFTDTLPDQSRVHERVVRDGSCLTSRGPGTALEFSLALVDALCGKAKRDAVAAPMVL
ncbi:DJ-1 family glyoxalase III [Alcanivorax sediminis]|uniref:DJ-1 family protein n=1 Tax=Alcanivorax sediminis TaxID=2663008 RepID=A0A6N7LUS0_9GAMM|nr:DJ-1 family glyoxalase III [Alcanivorax sediminis]MQX53136.1 DJ-1 family protein [Alcanivorax sediminis]